MPLVMLRNFSMTKDNKFLFVTYKGSRKCKVITE